MCFCAAAFNQPSPLCVKGGCIGGCERVVTAFVLFCSALLCLYCQMQFISGEQLTGRDQLRILADTDLTVRLLWSLVSTLVLRFTLWKYYLRPSSAIIPPEHSIRCFVHTTRQPFQKCFQAPWLHHPHACCSICLHFPCKSQRGCI